MKIVEILSLLIVTTASGLFCYTIVCGDDPSLKATGESLVNDSEFQNQGLLSSLSNERDLTAQGSPLPRVGVKSSTAFKKFPALNAIDGDVNTYWASKKFRKQWIYVDMGDVYPVSQVILKFESAYGKKFVIEMSDNAKKWSVKKNVKNGQPGTNILDLPPGTTGRYVRMKGRRPGTNKGYAISDFAILGGDSGSPPPSTYVSLPRVKVEASSARLPTPNAIDGDRKTRWQSKPKSETEWIYIDMGNVYSVSRVLLYWGFAYGKEYVIETSNDAVLWTVTKTVSEGSRGTTILNLPTGTKTRYVRLRCIQAGTKFGINLWEFSLQGDTADPANTSTPTLPPASPMPTETILTPPREPATSPPSLSPTPNPTTSPPTTLPTQGPTLAPTPAQTETTQSPTTSSPTPFPSQEPTMPPSPVPTEGTQSPTTSSPSPTNGTQSPTTSIPTHNPTQGPTAPPSSTPTESTQRPTTSSPTPSTQEPTTLSPSPAPTPSPMEQPTLTPSPAPTEGTLGPTTSTPTFAATKGTTLPPSWAPTPAATTSSPTPATQEDPPELTLPKPKVYPLNECEGSCDNNDDNCKGDLRCFKRWDVEPVHGCSGTGESGKDYCFDPSQVTSHRFRLHWEDGYMWQLKPHERWFCMLFNSSEAKLRIERCGNENMTKWEFVFLSDVDVGVGDQIRMSGTDRCIATKKNSNVALTLQNCNIDKPQQRWVPGVEGDFHRKKFDIRPVANTSMCITQPHHPKVGEKIYMTECEKAHQHTTGYWTKYW